MILLKNTVLSVRPENNNFTGKFKAITEYDINYIYKIDKDLDGFNRFTSDTSGDNEYSLTFKEKSTGCNVYESFKIYDTRGKGFQNALSQMYNYTTKQQEANEILKYKFNGDVLITAETDGNSNAN